MLSQSRVRPTALTRRSPPPESPTNVPFRPAPGSASQRALYQAPRVITDPLVPGLTTGGCGARRARHSPGAQAAIARRLSDGVKPVSEEVLAQQQTIADSFYQLKLVPTSRSALPMRHGRLGRRDDSKQTNEPGAILVGPRSDIADGIAIGPGTRSSCCEWSW